MKKMITLTAIAGLVLALAPAVQATDITVANHSFEDYALTDGQYVGSNPSAWPDWTAPAGNYEQSALGLWNPTDPPINGTTGSPIPAPGDGVNLITGQSPIRLWELYQQPDSHTILANQVYTLTTAVGERTDSYKVSTTTISLKAGSHDGTALATRTLVRDDLVAEGVTPGDLHDFEVPFDSADYPAQVGQALYIVYEAETSMAGQAQFDNVRLSYVGAAAATPGMLIYGK